MINVGFDGACLRHPRTGVGNYTYCLLDHLQNSDLSIHILDGIKHRSLEDYAGDYSGEAATPSALSQAPREVARKSTLLRNLHRRFVDFSFKSAVDKLDIYHATNFLPARRVDIPVIPLIHDVSHIRHPEWHPRDRIELLTSRASEFAEAPVINTVSQFSASEIEKTLSVQAERIRITPPGTNPLYFGEPQGVGTILAELDLAAGHYFLSVGTQEPRKNLTTLLSAYMDFSGRNEVKHPLVIVGPKGWGDLNLPAGTDALQRSGSVRFLGYVTERVMHVLYANASAFLYPSLYEGFGMPVAEAMAAGTRPIIATSGAPEEVAGSEGFTAPALDVGAWSSAMQTAIDEQWFLNDDRRARLVQRAGTFTWKENAATTLGIYHEIAGASGAA